MGEFHDARTWLAAGLIVVLSAGNAKAGGKEPFEPIDAEALIKSCWDISEKQRASGITSEMRYWTAETIRCLEEVVIDQARAMFESDDLRRIDFPRKISTMRKSFGSLYWSIYNEHKECGTRCGTHRHLFHLAQYANLIEEMIEDMIAERNNFRF